MSNRRNHRRDEEGRSEHGPRWENADPGAGCNSTHVARARKWWKRHAARVERRTGSYASWWHARRFRPTEDTEE